MKWVVVAAIAYLAICISASVAGLFGHGGLALVLIGYGVVLLVGFELGDGNGRHQAGLDRGRGK